MQYKPQLNNEPQPDVSDAFQVMKCLKWSMCFIYNAIVLGRMPQIKDTTSKVLVVLFQKLSSSRLSRRRRATRAPTRLKETILRLHYVSGIRFLYSHAWWKGEIHVEEHLLGFNLSELSPRTRFNTVLRFD